MVHSVLEAAVETGDAPAHVLHARPLLPNLITGAAFSYQFMDADPPKTLPIDELTDLIMAAIVGNEIRGSKDDTNEDAT